MRGLVISKADLDSGKYRLGSRLAVKVSGDAVDDLGGSAVPVYVVHAEELKNRQFRIAPGRVQQIVAATNSVSKLKSRTAVPVYVVSGTLGNVAWTPDKSIINSDKHAILWSDFSDQGPIWGMVHKVAGFSQPSALRCPWMEFDGFYFPPGSYLKVPDELVGKMIAIRYANGEFAVQELGEHFSPGQNTVARIAVYEDLTLSEVASLQISL